MLPFEDASLWRFGLSCAPMVGSAEREPDELLLALVLSPGGRGTAADIAARLRRPLRTASRLLRGAQRAGLVASSVTSAHEPWGDRVHSLTDEGIFAIFGSDGEPDEPHVGET
jgi:hypothetical protein